MKYLTLLIFTLLLFSCTSSSDQRDETDLPTTEEASITSTYKIGFYNVENLFDTIDDPYTEDEWFLPESETQWDQEKYETKLNHLATVIDAMNDADGGPDLIGLCEVENKSVVVDLSKEDVLQANHYEVIHFESPDKRGIDVAAMYNPEKFKLLESKNIPVIMPEDPGIKTRDILMCKFKVVANDEIFYFYVNHWSSRRGGAEETFFKRKNCAMALLDDMHFQFKDYSHENIIIVGDMNDYPTDKSLIEVLGAGEPETEATLWNIQFKNHINGLGTYNYKAEWGCLDNIVVSPQIYDKLITKDAEILKEDWMLYTDNEGIEYPDRTYGGSNYYGGYSDHLPIYLEIEF